MDYEKKYKQLHTLISDLYPFMSEYCKEKVEGFFPELKESEDENIRKTIIEHFRWNTKQILNEFSNKKALAWLEKQGKKKEILCDKCKKEQPSHSCQDITALGRCYIEGMNTSNKVEPKFKVGDWIINRTDATIMQIVNNIDFYESVEIGGQRRTDTYNYVEWDFRLWTIDDAMDGYVLQLGEVTAIFKEFIGNEHCRCYCSVYEGEFKIPSQDNRYGCYNATPATKEQRDQLEKAMKEAGYTFNFEKKELNKIDARENLTLDGDLMEVDCAIVEQKPAWSDEDEKILRTIISDGIRGAELDMLQIDWLKSLKERIGG